MMRVSRGSRVPKVDESVSAVDVHVGTYGDATAARAGIGGRWIGPTCLLALASLIGCTTTAPPPPRPTVPEAERAFVLVPTLDYPLVAEPIAAEKVRAAHASFDQGASPAAVRTRALEVLEADPAFHPAMVLGAQADFLESKNRQVTETLTPVVDELPGYSSAALLLARAHELLGERVVAYDRYRDLAPSSRVASERAAELRAAAFETVHERLDDALARGRIEDAESHLDQLRAWAPGDISTLDAERRLLFSAGDRQAEMETLRRLLLLEPATDYRHRLASLELSDGDVRAGLDLYTELVAEVPDDAEMREGLARAKFFYQLELLPPRVQELSRAAELARADLATVLYWLFPSVRYSEVDAPPIAQDILDEPGREEILRVLDLDLLGVDRTLHRFSPSNPATRRAALASMLGLMQKAEQPPACLDSEAVVPAPERSRKWVCTKAAECGLIGEELECLPAATLAGAETFELVRRTLDLLGSS